MKKLTPFFIKLEILGLEDISRMMELSKLSKILRMQSIESFICISILKKNLIHKNDFIFSQYLKLR